MAVDSNSGFNSPGYKEYDPTPYGGGYNFTLTYGKPLAPTDSICYPPSISNPPDDDSFSNGFSYSSIPNPYVNDIVIDFETRKIPQPQNSYPPNTLQKEEEEEEEEEKQQQGFGGDNGNWVYEPYRGYWGEDAFSNGYGYGYGHDSDYRKPVDSPLGEKDYSEKKVYSQSDFEYGRREDNCDNVGRQVPLPPVDDPGPCAGLFGYFPCLSKKDQKLYTDDHGGGGGGGSDEQGCGNQLRGTAEYLFGRNLYPYGESRNEDVSYRYPCYAYERHYPEQPHYVQVDYNEQHHYVQVDYNEQQVEQPHYVHVDYNEQPHCVQVGYNEPSNYVQVEYSDQPLFQDPGCYGAYQDKEYLQLNYADDSYINHQYFYYNHSGYTDE